MTPDAPGPDALDPDALDPDAGDLAAGPVRAVVRAPSPQGLHARPAARVVETARRFAAETTLVVGATTARAKDLLDVLALAAVGGAEVTLQGHGPDAPAAVAALTQLFAAFHAET